MQTVSTAETRIPGAPALRVIGRSSSAAPLPASAAGRASILAALDAMGHCLGVYSVGGILLRQTSPLERLIDQSPRRDDLLGLIQAAITEVVGMSRRMDWRDALPATSMRDTHYVVEAAIYQPADDIYVLVNVAQREVPPSRMTDEQLRERYRLTSAEIRVARLLAEMKSNKAIACALQVSEHTARHHTEHVLRKLEVRSRNAVAEKLLVPRDL